LCNQAVADEGILRAAFIAAMCAMFVVALAIPEAWNDAGGALNAPLTLAIALGLVRLGHLCVYALAAAGDVGLRRQLARTAVPVVAAALLLVTGALVGGRGQTGLWVTALIVDYSGTDSSS
jgi:low temperature requirement protein LtrA